MRDLNSLADLESALTAPGPIVLYKHSTQCGVCDGAIEEVRAFEGQHAAAATVYYLDLLEHRDVSNEIAKRLGIRHESPQAIVLKDGKPVLVLNHRQVKADALRGVLISATQK